MRKAMAVGVVFLAACVVFAATLLAQSQSKHAPDTEAAHTKALAAQITPLRMKTGLWQSTLTGKNSQMGAGSPMTYKSCVTAKSLTGRGWANHMMPGKCSFVTILKSTATDAEAQGKGCEMAHGMTADLHTKFHLRRSRRSTN